STCITGMISNWDQWFQSGPVLTQCKGQTSARGSEACVPLQLSDLLERLNRKWQ
ncbi:hypothetical protein KUCAC02_020389, partial [Chaenocephalus aceratus]